MYVTFTQVSRANLDTAEIVNGQLVFTKDTGDLYLDVSGVREPVTDVYFDPDKSMVALQQNPDRPYKLYVSKDSHDVVSLFYWDETTSSYQKIGGDNFSTHEYTHDEFYSKMEAGELENGAYTVDDTIGQFNPIAELPYAGRRAQMSYVTTASGTTFVPSVGRTPAKAQLYEISPDFTVKEHYTNAQVSTSKWGKGAGGIGFIGTSPTADLAFNAELVQLPINRDRSNFGAIITGNTSMLDIKTETKFSNYAFIGSQKSGATRNAINKFALGSTFTGTDCIFAVSRAIEPDPIYIIKADGTVIESEPVQTYPTLCESDGIGKLYGYDVLTDRLFELDSVAGTFRYGDKLSPSGDITHNDMSQLGVELSKMFRTQDVIHLALRALDGTNFYTISTATLTPITGKHYATLGTSALGVSIGIGADYGRVGTISTPTEFTLVRSLNGGSIEFDTYPPQSDITEETIVQVDDSNQYAYFMYRDTSNKKIVYVVEITSGASNSFTIPDELPQFVVGKNHIITGNVSSTNIYSFDINAGVTLLKALNVGIKLPKNGYVFTPEPDYLLVSSIDVESPRTIVIDTNYYKVSAESDNYIPLNESATILFDDYTLATVDTITGKQYFVVIDNVAFLMK